MAKNKYVVSVAVTFSGEVIVECEDPRAAYKRIKESLEFNIKEPVSHNPEIVDVKFVIYPKAKIISTPKKIS